MMGKGQLYHSQGLKSDIFLVTSKEKGWYLKFGGHQFLQIMSII